MGKRTLCICENKGTDQLRGYTCENKGADQLRSNSEAEQRLCFRYTILQSLFFPNLKFSALCLFSSVLSDLFGNKLLVFSCSSFAYDILIHDPLVDQVSLLSQPATGLNALYLDIKLISVILSELKYHWFSQ